MNYLPIEVDGQRVHAGFWLRLGAGLIDILALIPLVILLTWIDGLSIGWAMVSMVLSSLCYFLYVWYFHAVYGATLGKAAVGIRVTYVDGSRIGWQASFMRASVDFLLAMASMVAYLSALRLIDNAQYVSLGWFDRSMLMAEQLPAWNTALDAVTAIWGLSELIVLLMNERKRSIHDFIAGTVVIRKEFAKDSIYSAPTGQADQGTLIS